MFLNPWAWLGLVALAAPIVAHLLARRPAKRLAYPSLRFLQATRLTPVQRGRPADIGLLIVRCAIVAAAVAALAQPTWGQSGLDTTSADIARAIVVDASWSVPIAAARKEAEAIRATATTARIVESAAPPQVLTAATGWLATQPMQRELVVVSDFQAGSIDAHDFDAVPADVGVRFVRVSGARTPPPPATTTPAVVLMAGAQERDAAEAARRAAESQGAPLSGRTGARVGIVFPGYEVRASLAGAPAPLREPWMFEVVARVARDEHAHLYSTGLTWSAGAAPNPELIFFTDAPAGSLASAALISAVARAASPEPPATERVTATIPDATLEAWKRAPAPFAAQTPSPFVRWLWIGALVLLGLEALVRRTARSEPPVEVGHERAA